MSKDDIDNNEFNEWWSNNNERVLLDFDKTNIPRSIYNITKKEYEDIKQNHKWVKVEDHLPNNDEYVLWKFENGHIIYECIDKDDDIKLFLKGFEITGRIVEWKHVD